MRPCCTEVAGADSLMGASFTDAVLIGLARRQSGHGLAVRTMVVAVGVVGIGGETRAASLGTPPGKIGLRAISGLIARSWLLFV
jgi:hypothetical protein